MSDETGDPSRATGKGISAGKGKGQGRGLPFLPLSPLSCKSGGAGIGGGGGGGFGAGCIDGFIKQQICQIRSIGIGAPGLQCLQVGCDS